LDNRKTIGRARYRKRCGGVKRKGTVWGFLDGKGRVKPNPKERK
jgi:hypothetical protein